MSTSPDPKPVCYDADGEPVYANPKATLPVFDALMRSVFIPSKKERKR